MKLVVANWKANKTASEVLDWWKTFSKVSWAKKNVTVVLCPPVVHLFLLRDLVASTRFPFPVTLGVQDLSPFPDGSYTGEVTARMVGGVVTHAILGHSERRRWFGETSQRVAMKVEQALTWGITPIVSVDRDNVREQLGQFDDQILAKLLVMYEPPEAISIPDETIGHGKPADVRDVEQMAERLLSQAPKAKILYGGSVKSTNVSTFSRLPMLSGVVVGTASTVADEFVAILNHF